MTDSVVLPGVGAGKKSMNEASWGGGKMIYPSIFGFTLGSQSFGGAGGKNAQITFNLTVVSDHRSNILYAINPRNSIVCQK